jgi:hypothetical protein
MLLTDVNERLNSHALQSRFSEPESTPTALKYGGQFNFAG